MRAVFTQHGHSHTSGRVPFRPRVCPFRVHVCASVSCAFVYIRKTVNQFDGSQDYMIISLLPPSRRQSLSGRLTCDMTRLLDINEDSDNELSSQDAQDPCSSPKTAPRCSTRARSKPTCYIAAPAPPPRLLHQAHREKLRENLNAAAETGSKKAADTAAQLPMFSADSTDERAHSVELKQDPSKSGSRVRPVHPTLSFLPTIPARVPSPPMAPCCHPLCHGIVLRPQHCAFPTCGV